jgi:hypothetical protein
MKASIYTALTADDPVAGFRWARSIPERGGWVPWPDTIRAGL